MLDINVSGSERGVSLVEVRGRVDSTNADELGEILSQEIEEGRTHIVLDLATHTQDIALAPFFGETRLGLGLYDIPPLAFLVEISYGLLCWLLFRGSKGLLAVIVLFNLANLSFFVASMPGPESLLADRPTALVAAVAAQIAITLAAVWYFSRERAAELEHPSRRLARAFA